MLQARQKGVRAFMSAAGSSCRLPQCARTTLRSSSMLGKRPERQRCRKSCATGPRSVFMHLAWTLGCPPCLSYGCGKAWAGNLAVVGSWVASLRALDAGT